jgi:hypothetical protein
MPVWIRSGRGARTLGGFLRNGRACHAGVPKFAQKAAPLSVQIAHASPGSGSGPITVASCAIPLECSETEREMLYWILQMYSGDEY